MPVENTLICLASEARAKTLNYVIQNQGATIKSISAALSYGEFSMLQHLMKLEANHLLKRTKTNREWCYYVDNNAINVIQEIIDWLESIKYDIIVLCDDIQGGINDAR
jgi:predicted transcriptional regulator